MTLDGIACDGLKQNLTIKIILKLERKADWTAEG